MPANFSIELLRSQTLREGRREIEEWLAASKSAEVQARSPKTPHRNIGFAAAHALLGGLFAYRERLDAEEAQSWFSIGDRLTSTFVSLVRAGLPATRWSGFELLHCNILASNEDATQDLALCLNQLQSLNAGPEEGITHLIALAALGAREDFLELHASLQAHLKKKPNPFHAHLLNYVAAHKEVLLRDEFAFTKAIDHCRNAYAATEHDKSLTGRRVHFGGGNQHSAVFDFMGTVVVKLACRHGLNVVGTGDYIPLDFIPDLKQRQVAKR